MLPVFASPSRTKGAVCLCALTLAAGLALHATPAMAVTPRQRPVPPPVPTFGYDNVVAMARKLAMAPYDDKQAPLPAALQNLTYDQYRDIRFRPDRAIWRDTDLPFQIEMFHRGKYFLDKVDIDIIENGRPTPLAYDPDYFSFGPVFSAAIPSISQLKIPGDGGMSNLGYAGFRIHAPINRPDYFDEFAVFLGASYFRAVGRGEVYGLSARGLALKTAEPSGEEFPRFKTFWIEKPQPDSSVINVDALLDSVSVAGAYSFAINPGAATVMDVKFTLFPRVEIDKIGIAPMSSMFYFAPNDRIGVDDFRPAVHDSDGLEMYSGRGEWIWRPLSNPKQLQVSAFVDSNPKGFGLLQRARQFADYEDLEASYEKRPSLWVEPKGDWGDGHVMLIEIPTDSEIHDNIVAFWRPDAPLDPMKPYSLEYRLSWADAPPIRPSLSQVVRTSIGRDSAGKDRLIAVDYGPGEASDDSTTTPVANVTASAGQVSDVVVEPNPDTGGWRVTFHLDPATADSSELRIDLVRDQSPIAETWLYRWTKG